MCCLSVHSILVQYWGKVNILATISLNTPHPINRNKVIKRPKGCGICWHHSDHFSSLIYTTGNIEKSVTRRSQQNFKTETKTLFLKRLPRPDKENAYDLFSFVLSFVLFFLITTADIHHWLLFISILLWVLKVSPMALVCVNFQI